MATKTLHYDHVTHLVRRENSFTQAAGTGTKTSPHCIYAKHLVKAVHYRINVAGTAAAFTSRYIIGTNTATNTIGTQAINTTLSFPLGTSNDPKGLTIAAGALVPSFLIVGDDTGATSIIYEYETLPDAELTA